MSAQRHALYWREPTNDYRPFDRKRDMALETSPQAKRPVQAQVRRLLLEPRRKFRQAPPERQSMTQALHLTKQPTFERQTFYLPFFGSKLPPNGLRNPQKRKNARPLYFARL